MMVVSIQGLGATSSESALNVDDKSQQGKATLSLPLSLHVFSCHSKKQDILFSQPLVFPEMALTLLFDNKNVNRLWTVEFLLLILPNS